jgi:hypothetical protein
MEEADAQRANAISQANAADQADQQSIRDQYKGLDQFNQQRYGQQFNNQNKALQAYQQAQMTGPQAQQYLQEHQQRMQGAMQAPTQVQGGNGALAARYQQQAQQRGAAAVAPQQLALAQQHLQGQQADTGRQLQRSNWENNAYGQNTAAQQGLERAGIMDWTRNSTQNSAERWNRAGQAGAENYARGQMVQGIMGSMMGGMGGMGGGMGGGGGGIF